MKFRTSVAILALALTSQVVQGQDTASLFLEAKTMLAEGVNSGDMDALMASTAAFERLSADGESAYLAHYYLGRVQEQMANLVRADKDALIDHLNKGIDHLEESVEMNEDFADGYALLGSMIGQKAGLQPIKAMFLGPKSTRLIAKAAKMEPDNPRIVLLQATGKFHTPKMWGGDKEEAFNGFERAVALAKAEEVSDPRLPSWGLDNALAWVGIAHLDAGRVEEARASFDEAMEVNPDNSWVSRTLMPQLDAGSK